MYFTKDQLYAMIALAVDMADADNNVREIETQTIADELMTNNSIKSISEINQMIAVAVRMDRKAAFQIIRNMSINQQKYVFGFLMHVMACDQDFNKEETTLLCGLQALTNIASVTPDEVWKFYLNENKEVALVAPIEKLLRR